MIAKGCQIDMSDNDTKFYTRTLNAGVMFGKEVENILMHPYTLLFFQVSVSKQISCLLT